MQSVNTYYINLKTLEAFIKKQSIIDSPLLLIQVFTANNNETFIELLVQNIVSLLPQAQIIGTTTDGEIMNGKVSTHKTVLSFTRFEHSRLKVSQATHLKDGFFAGQSLAKDLMEKDTKLIISFVDGLNTNGEAFLKGVHSVSRAVMIAGGLAGDNATFTQTFVFCKEHILSNGAVGVSISGKKLQINNDYSFNWNQIGRELTISKVEYNRVYMIEDMTAVETYKRYLGIDIEAGLPAIGIEFPLITVRNGVKVARAVLAKHEDGSLSFAGNFHQGEKVQFGYGNPLEILDCSKEIFNNIKAKPSEVIFIYSCMARRRFMPEVIEMETTPLQDIAPTAGFFSYGEFFSSKKKELLNQSITILSLSEQDNPSVNAMDLKIKEKQKVNSSANALIHLLNTTSQEAMEQKALIQAQGIFETLFEKSPDGIVLLEKDHFIQCNQKILDIFGYASERIFIEQDIQNIYPPKQPNGKNSFFQLYRIHARTIKEGHAQFDFMFQRQNGELFWMDIMLTQMTLNKKKIIYAVCRDISQKKELELELARQKNTLYHQAHHDTLTGLANYHLFMKKLSKDIKRSIKKKSELFLIFLDLDRFKKINDSLGHDVGDKVIRIIAQRLTDCLSQEGLVARLGGDEFLVLFSHISEKEFKKEVKAIIETVRNPIFIEHHRLYTSASIGVSRYPLDVKNDEDNAETNLLKYADAAMYKAKDEGGNNYQFYTREMTDLAYEHVMMEKDLRESMKNGDFEVYYQPQVDIRSAKIIGIEALVRWNHPLVGMLSPNIFMPLTEKTGLIIELDLWVMQQAMKDISQWYAQGLIPGTLALNMSMKQLEHPNLAEIIQENFENFHFKPEWLELEITETEMMKKPDEVISILEDLSAMGMNIAIDDFGTGYSSLSHLKRLPINKLKIDKSFVQDVPVDEDASIIVKTIISLAKSLKIDILAEGVETKAQKDFLIAQECYKVQGYYYSQPLTSTQIHKLFVAQKKLSEALES